MHQNIPTAGDLIERVCLDTDFLVDFASVCCIAAIDFNQPEEIATARSSLQIAFDCWQRENNAPGACLPPIIEASVIAVLIARGRAEAKHRAEYDAAVMAECIQHADFDRHGNTLPFDQPRL